MNILVLASDVPATASMPGSPRLFSLCRGLSENHRLTLVVFDRSSEEFTSSQAAPETSDVFHHIVFLPEAPEPSWWGKQVHRVRQDASFITRWRTPAHFAAHRRRLESLMSAGKFDIVYVDGLLASQYMVNLARECPAVIDVHDCASLLLSRRLKSAKDLSERLRLYSAYRSIARIERSLSRTYGLIITNSSVDERCLRELDPAGNTLTIGNGVDCEYFRSTTASSDVSRLVFTGVMDYGPNEDAAIYFCETILPLITAQRPDVQLWIVGKGESTRVRALGTRPGVHVTGSVPDVRPYLEAAGIFVCPLRHGAGVKNKVLAALAMSRAVVATPLSVEGLDLDDGEDLVLADTPDEFAARVLRLIDRPWEAVELGRVGRGTVQRKYSWATSAQLLEDSLLRLVCR